MARTRVERCDINSELILFDGYVFRPVPAYINGEKSGVSISGAVSRFKVGDFVTVEHIPDTSTALVGGLESWANHGETLDGSGNFIPTSLSWAGAGY